MLHRPTRAGFPLTPNPQNRWRVPVTLQRVLYVDLYQLYEEAVAAGGLHVQSTPLSLWQHMAARGVGGLPPHAVSGEQLRQVIWSWLWLPVVVHLHVHVHVCLRVGCWGVLGFIVGNMSVGVRGRLNPPITCDQTSWSYAHCLITLVLSSAECSPAAC